MCKMLYKRIPVALTLRFKGALAGLPPPPPPPLLATILLLAAAAAKLLAMFCRPAASVATCGRLCWRVAKFCRFCRVTRPATVIETFNKKLVK